MKTNKVMVRLCGICLLVTLVVSQLWVTAPVLAAETYQLKFTGQWSEDNQQSYPIRRWAKALEERTGGRVKVTLYFNETLGKADTALDMIKSGAADIAGIATAYFPKVFPITDVGLLPNIVPNQAIGLEILYATEYQGLMAKELADNGVKVLWWQTTDPAYIFFRKSKVTRLEDLKGLKIRTVAGPPVKTMQALGAVGVALPGSEVYMALDRGTIDALCTSPSAIPMRKYQEVTKYCLWYPTYGGQNMYAMTQKKWNSFPPDIQAIMSELNFRIKYDFLNELWRTNSGTPESVTKLGLEVYSLSPAEEGRWDAAIQPIYNEWLSEMKSKGFPGREALDLAKAIARLYKM
jgi:TRAP-type C4-dicarboxylate transport system substrate-binding protein